MDFIGLMSPEQAKARFEVKLAEAETEAKVRQAQGSAGTSAANQAGFLSRVMSLLPLAAK